MLVPYNPDESKDDYFHYYQNQVGSGLGVYQGAPIQRGNGIGSLLRGLAKSTLPLLARGGKMLGKRLVSAGANIAKDVIDGRNFGDAAKSRFTEGGKGLLNDLLDKVSTNSETSATRRTTSLKRRKRQNALNNKRQASLFRNVDVKA